MVAKLKNGMALMRAKALEKEGVCLSSEYIGVDHKYRFQCVNGHLWEATFDCVVRREQWCAICSGRKVMAGAQLQKAREVASQQDGACLSSEYRSSQSSMKWRCAEGHEWEGSYSNIVNHGKWCPWCAGNKVDATEQLRRAHETARRNGGDLLSKTYVGNKAPMRWRCAEGHEWDAAFSTVVGRGAWCGRCRGTQRDAEAQLAKACEVAASKNGRCLSATYTNNSDQMEWQCERGHTWKAPFYVVVQAGSWCPTCSAGLKERLVRHTLEELFGTAFKKHRPDWLRNTRTGRLMELDGYSPELKLAFEYQGPQHYKAVLLFKMDQTHLERGRYRDDLKSELCRTHGIALLEVPYTVESQELPEWIYRAIEDRLDTQHLVAKMRDWREIQLTEWMASESYSIDALCEHAKTNGGECLSEAYLGARAKHRWRCAEGHQWNASWDSVNNQGSWCPVCCGNVILNPFQELQEIARSRDGELISPAFMGMQKKHHWRCARGHEWKAKPSHVKSVGSWCPVCSGHLLINPLQQLQEIAEQRGGKCLSDKYLDSKTNLSWRCAEGHEWEAVPSSVKTGRWCPTCAIRKRMETRRKKTKL